MLSEKNPPDTAAAAQAPAEQKKVVVVLDCEHTHEGKPYNKDDKLQVNAADAAWLIAHKKAHKEA